MSKPSLALPPFVETFVFRSLFVVLLGNTLLFAQEKDNPLEVQGLRQTISQDRKNPTATSVDPSSKTNGQAKKGDSDSSGTQAPMDDTKSLLWEKRAQDEKEANEILALKSKEGGPRRFAADLFDIRQSRPEAATDGGVAED